MTWTPRLRSRPGSRPSGPAARSRSGRSSRRTPRSREPALIEQVFRDEWGRVLACLIGYFGDFDLAEEATAEAFALAAQRWPDAGMPDNPGAWLVTTARHRAIDRLRRDRVLAAKLPLLAQQPEEAEDVLPRPPVPDERLELVFLGCHPALAIDAQVALTLRAVAGLTTEEIARAFLVPAETMKRRLTRAKSKIKVAGIPFGVPVTLILDLARSEEHTSELQSQFHLVCRL